MNPYALHLTATVWSIRDALSAVSGVIKDEAVTCVPIGFRGYTDASRGPRSITRLSALIHQREKTERAAWNHAQEREDITVNARAGIHRIGCTPAPVRPELLDLARTGAGRLAQALEDAAWIVASTRRNDPLRMPDGRTVSVAASPSEAYLRAALPGTPPETAAEVLGVLERFATGCWGTLHLDPPSMPLPGNPPCPCCEMRMLRVRCVGPRSAWTVVCAAGCTCAGTDCWCGMDELMPGTRHVWAWSCWYGQEQTAA
jgi:hypothetical protein